MKSRSAAVLIALFLGGIGIHKFYLNKPGVGVIYLLFCWTFVPAVISIFEAIGYLSMTDDEFYRVHVDPKAGTNTSTTAENDSINRSVGGEVIARDLGDDNSIKADIVPVIVVTVFMILLVAIAQCGR